MSVRTKNSTPVFTCVGKLEDDPVMNHKLVPGTVWDFSHTMFLNQLNVTKISCEFKYISMGQATSRPAN